MTSLGGEPVLAGASRHPAIGSYRMPRRERDDAAHPLRHGRDRGVGGQRMLEREHEAEPCAGRDGLGPAGVARGRPGLSFGRSTTEAELDAFVAVWREDRRRRARAA